MHIAVIPDGNRRYMQKKGILDLKKSYMSGIKKFYDFLGWCIELDINEVTIYALSTENIENRSKEEINTLLSLFAKQAIEVIENGKLKANEVKVKICGDLKFLSDRISDITLRKKVIRSLRELEERTKNYNKAILNLAIAYGGRREILNAANKVLSSGEELNEENLRKNLWVASYPDIIIRTAEKRLSNFLLFQGAYSEIYFVPKLWQEFEKEDLVSIVKDFNSRERRFGG
ncbi:MAG: polyprenyl diphosphate synthase [Candidatus Altiarchaeota archaeon]